MAHVLSLFRAPRKRLAMEELPEVRAVADAGFEGCAHARPGRSRQVLLVDRETLEAMELRPGVLCENITDQRLECEQPCNWAAASGRRNAARSERSLHTLRSDGEDPAGTSERALGTARNALPGD